MGSRHVIANARSQQQLKNKERFTLIDEQIIVYELVSVSVLLQHLTLVIWSWILELVDNLTIVNTHTVWSKMLLKLCMHRTDLHKRT